MNKEMKVKFIFSVVCIFLIGIIGFLIEPHKEVVSKEYHLYLNCTGGNIKLLIPKNEINSFEKVLKGYSVITNLEIVIKGQKYLMGP